MSLLTKIVKSIAVVDDRINREIQPEPNFTPKAFPVIKQGILKNGLPVDVSQMPRSQQSYLDELNRVKVEIAQAKAELRTLRREMEEANEQVAQVQAILAADGEDADIRMSQIVEAQEQAKEEARQILANATIEAQQQIEELKNHGYLEGFNKGYEEAKNEYLSENQPKVQQLDAMLNAISDYEKVQIEQNQQDMVQLILAVANKVICKELSVSPETIVDMLYETLDENKRQEFIKIILAKDLLPIDTKASQEIRSILTGLGANISVYVDGDMESGGCVVETPKGFTDASISTQLNNIGNALLHSEL